jgi:hypothetical protein
LTFSGADAIYRLSLLFTQKKFKAGNSPKPTTVAENNHPPKKKTPRASAKKQKTRRRRWEAAAIPFVRRERGRGEGVGPQPTTNNARVLFFLSLSHRGTLFVWEKQS